MTTGDTRERIMAAARLTVQDRGYSGLSFRELAKDVGIKSASIHHYFPTKGELGGALASAIAPTSRNISTDCWQRVSIKRPASGNTPMSSARRCATRTACAWRASWPPNTRNCLRKFGQRWSSSAR